jgi:hypothetical protein
MARLLNCGFPLGVALELAREESVVGGQYLVVGDSGLAVAQAQNGTPNLCDVEATNGGFELSFKAFSTSHQGMGTMILPHIQGNEQYALSSTGVRQTFDLSQQELAHFLALEDGPVRVDGELQWRNQVNVSKF